MDKPIIRIAGITLFLVCLAACQAVAAVPTALPPQPSSAPTALPAWRVAEYVPDSLHASLTLPAGLPEAQSPDQAALFFGLAPSGAPGIDWVYALAAAFPTAADGYPLTAVQALWNGEDAGELAGDCLLVSPDTAAALTDLWGAQPSSSVIQLPAGELLDKAWQRRECVAILPFEELNSRWKTLEVDGQSPLRTDFDPQAYPLSLRFAWQGALEGLNLALPQSNWQRGHLTVLLLTGTTALTRGTAARMAEMGVTYPGEKIRDWFTQADLAHVSNEVSFTEKCPPPDPFSPSLMFCSAPQNIDLFDYLGVDVIEVTGNHVADYGKAVMLDTLAAYRERGWRYYAAGENEAQARQPLLIEHNGNRIAFLGCNQAGPESVWARENEPGVAQCDLDDLSVRLAELKARGYLTVVTLQYDESYRPRPTELQERFFRQVSAAGADILSGSQAHFPQAYAFTEQGFIHYGPGNLFFDQMDYPVVGTRREFLVRYVIYANRLVGIELLTALLEDSAQPRPMTAAERRQFLEEYFTASGW